MTNKKIAKILYQVADLLELTNAVNFEIIAYRNAARKIEYLEKDINEIYRVQYIEGLKKIEGIGDTISENIVEIITTNKLLKLKKLLDKIPKIKLEINAIPGVGPKTTTMLYQILKPKSISDLIKKLNNRIYQKKLLKISIKEKTIQDILDNVKLKDKSVQRIPKNVALPIAEKFLKHIKNIRGVKKADIVGSLRRKVKTVKDIDIVAAIAATSQKSKVKSQKVIDNFTKFDGVKSIIAQGDTKASIITHEGIQIDLEILPLDCYGNLLQHFTGSKQHNIKLRTWAKENGFSVSEHGIKVIKNGKISKIIKCQEEECVYKTLGMQFIPPEIRNGNDEIELALDHRLPIN